MKKIASYIKYVLPLFIIGVLALLYGFSSKRNSQKKVKEIVVQFQKGNNHFLTHSMVNKLLIQNDTTVKNQPKRVIDLHGLEKRVLANPYVEKATVFLTLNGSLKTVIKQREPIARLVDKQGSFYVDKYGVVVPLSETFSARVPLVSGVNSSEEIKEITQLIVLINKDDFLKKEIVAIEKNSFNEYIFTVRSGNHKIDFGTITNANVKFSKLKAFYNKALGDNSIKNYKRINVKFRNQVVCSKQNQDGKQ